jgi:rapamycin-insensitive companion of mTOR
VLSDTPRAARTDTIPALLAALVDGPTEIGPALTQAFLIIIDSPRTRGYLTPGIDLEV